MMFAAWWTRVAVLLVQFQWGALRRWRAGDFSWWFWKKNRKASRWDSRDTVEKYGFAVRSGWGMGQLEQCTVCVTRGSTGWHRVWGRVEWPDESGTLIPCIVLFNCFACACFEPSGFFIVETSSPLSKEEDQAASEASCRNARF